MQIKPAHYISPFFSLDMIMSSIKFGKWSYQLDYLDDYHNRLATRLIHFIQDAGPDPCNRDFNLEPLVDFIMATKLWEKSVDYMYRYYVYYLLSQHESIDIDAEEFRYLMYEFESY